MKKAIMAAFFLILMAVFLPSAAAIDASLGEKTNLQFNEKEAEEFKTSLKEIEKKEAVKGLLPGVPEDDCSIILPKIDSPEVMQEYNPTGVLACAIKTGRIKLWMVPYFIRYFIQFLLGIAGLVSVLFMMIGGYQYVYGGLSEDKESGKNTLKYAIIGLLVSLLAFALVSAVQFAVTEPPKLDEITG